MSSAFGARRVAARTPVQEAPSVRLRTVLFLLILCGLVAWLWPRGRAAWQLHNHATIYADYSLCLVGPLGPELLRSGSPELFRLLRLRVLTAPAESQPFADCEKFSRSLGRTEAQSELHLLQASEFREYLDEESGAPSVQELAPDRGELARLAERAWPFVREGYVRLIQASSHAKEAVHPSAPPAPGVGSGLPARRVLYRSTAAFGDQIVVALGSGAHLSELLSKDGGVNFAPGGRALTSELIERCVIDAEGRAFTVTLTEAGERFVLSHGPGAPPHASYLAERSARLVAIACDASSLVAVLSTPSSGEEELSFRSCPYRRPCQNFQVPRLGQHALRYPLDIARVDGDTVLSIVHGGVTRVTSSRDGGKTWTPWFVAFDRASLARDLGYAPPFRMLTAGDRVLLYGGARRENEPYYLLVSQDQGASFRAMEEM